MDVNSAIRVSGGQDFRVPFSVRYEVERLLTHGAINRCEVGYNGRDFWRRLSALPKRTAERVLRIMHNMAGESVDCLMNAIDALTCAIEQVLLHCEFQSDPDAVDAVAARVAGFDLSTPSADEGTGSITTSVVPSSDYAITRPDVIVASQQTHREDAEEEDNESAFRYLQIRLVMVTPTRVAACPA